LIAVVPVSSAQNHALKRTRRTLIAIAAVGIAPIVASYVAYYFWPRQAHVNYGELLTIASPAVIAGTRADGRPFRLTDLRGRWVLIVSASANCDANCERALYATRQARTMQGADQERVVRVWIATGGSEPSAELIAQHPGLERIRVESSVEKQLPIADGRIYLVDPIGNWVLAWPTVPDIKKLANDLGRLLRASQIG